MERSEGLLVRAPALILSALLMSGAAACSSEPAPSDAPPAAGAAFEVRGVVAEVESADSEPVGEATVVRADVPGGSDSDGALELGPAFVTTERVTNAEAVHDETDFWSIEVTLDADGDSRLRTLTGAAACMSEEARTGRIAILVDDVVVASPAVSVPCGSDLGSPLKITGDFTEVEATALAKSLT